MSPNIMKTLYAVSAAAILALGALHMATTFRLSSTPGTKVWFFGTGLAIALGGILNVLNQRYGLSAYGVRAACIGTNALMVCFAGVTGRVIGASVAEQAIMLTVLSSALILSALPSASISPPEPRA